MKAVNYVLAFASGFALGVLISKAQKSCNQAKSSTNLTDSVKTKLYALESRDYDYAQSSN
jgi:hypothetical protein